jgi:uncharacterized protein YndB with AHSA1/START domain
MPTAPPPRATIRVARRFAAPPDRVFDAWLDPKIAGRFLFKTPSGEMVRVAIDARMGGAFAMVERRNGEEVAHVGEYRELDRPRRLAFTFAVPKFSTETTRVAIDIEAAPPGSTLTLTHEGVLPDYAGRTEAGWGMILKGLAAALGEDISGAGKG